MIYVGIKPERLGGCLGTWVVRPRTDYETRKRVRQGIGKLRKGTGGLHKISRQFRERSIVQKTLRKSLTILGL